MPELPEVETSCRGIAPHIVNQTVQTVIIRNPRLRWPITPQLPMELAGRVIKAVSRRAKYLVLQTDKGALILHLGMSGCLRIVPQQQIAGKHDHVDIVFTNGLCLRLTDPRRFGAVLWTEDDPLQHPLLVHLGVEPLTRHFSANYIYQATRNKNIAIKLWLMQATTVVGVGNIYANEALFAAGIHPQRPAKELTLQECQRLVKNIKTILRAAIKQGGTTLRDFLSSEGKPGYFRHRLQAYGRGAKPCPRCKTLLSEIRLGQRATVYCTNCQK